MDSDQIVILIVALLAVVAAIALIAEKLKVPYPILLVLGGLGISFVPNLPRVSIEPKLVFFVFLPPLLYWAGVLTSFRDFRKNIRPILLLAVGLVLATTFAVAGVAMWIVPGLSFAAACVLGAIISPPDAVAATTVVERLHVPRRIVSILEGESLVNDASALVTLLFAIRAIEQGTFSLVDASGKFVLLAVGGICVGLLAGWLVTELRRRIHQPHVEGIISLLAPYLSYLPAEVFHFSGVLAVVTTGIFVSRMLPKTLSPEARMRQMLVWDTLIFLLNGAVFILIGLHLPSVVHDLKDRDVSIGGLIWASLVISATAIVVRMAWVFALAYSSRLIPWVRRHDPPPECGALLVIGWAGMRGIVSLAAALAVPIAISPGVAFPGRDKIVFITFCVILVTLVLQGLTLPLVIRAAKLGEDKSHEREEREARLSAAHAALSRLSILELEQELDPAIVERVRHEYEARVRSLGGTMKDTVDPSFLAPLRQANAIRRELIEAERRMITMLRDQNIIGDDILRLILRETDLEEAKLP